MKDIKVIIATHKQYWMPKDRMYLPLHVGAEGKRDKNGNILELGYLKDNTGDNISVKNPFYCELTGLYWAWKNLDCEYLGLVHYRRYFTVKAGLCAGARKRKNCILSTKEAEQILDKWNVIVPKARKYYIESLYSHYSHTHYEEHLVETKKIIEIMFPDYLQSFTRVMKHRQGYMFNMFIMKKDIADSYCSWLFPILETLEEKIDYKNYGAYQGRLFGRVSELLFNVWLDKNQIAVKEVKTIHLEKINWFIKGKAFLEAKFRNRKFKASF